MVLREYGTVKLAIVNTTENGKDGYEEAKDFTKVYVKNETVRVTIDSGPTVGSSNRI